MKMHPLTGLDALFLHLETPTMPMHVGALHVLDLPADYRGSFLSDMRRHMAARLSLAPALRRRLSPMPLKLANPAWVACEPDLNWHVVGITMRPGSGLAALEDLVGRLHPQMLERDRPLWRFHVIDGLVRAPDGSRRFAMYTQLHHAAVDGQAAVALAQAILDLSPKPPPRALPQRVEHKAGELGVGVMLRAAVLQQAQQISKFVQALPDASSTVVGLARGGVGQELTRWVQRVRTTAPLAPSDDATTTVRNFKLAPRTRLNEAVGEGRAYATTRLLLNELREVRQRHGITLNDAVLMICSGALRRFFLRHKALPRASLVAAVPISLRAAGDTSLNNQASMTLVSLGTHLADPSRRLAHVRAATAAMKATMASDKVKALMPTDYPSIGVPWLVEGVTKVYGRVAGKIPPVANLVISNVPGPTQPLYMAGARMVTNFPASIVVHGVALNVTVQTYDAALDIGLMACSDAMPDVRDLAADIIDSFNEFKAMPGRESTPAASR